MTAYRSFLLIAVVIYLTVVVVFHTQLRSSSGHQNTEPGGSRQVYTTTSLETTTLSSRAPAPSSNSSYVTKPSGRSISPIYSHCRHNVSSAAEFRPVGRHYVFSAYYDDRKDGNPPTVRIVALVKNDVRVRPSFDCHMTIGTDRKWSVEAELYEMCENHAKEYGGWILSCRLPRPQSGASTVPCHVTVSLSGLPASDVAAAANISIDEPMSATLDIYTTTPSPEYQWAKQNRQVAVCLPPLFGHVPSTTIVEFIEMSRLLGVDHIIVYRAGHLALEVANTLNYYSELGHVTMIPWNIPVDDKLIWYHGQLLAINDCLYRTMHAFSFVLFNDIDEFIVPHQQDDLLSMINSLRRRDLVTGVNATTTSNVTASRPPLTSASNNEYCGYSFQSTFFDPMLTGMSAHVLYDLESDLRTKAFSRVRTKVIVRPRAVFEVGIHHVSRPLSNSDTASPTAVLHVDTEVAYVHHYRKCSGEFDYKMNCQVFVRDEYMSRYIPALRHNVHQTLWILKDRQDANRSTNRRQSIVNDGVKPG